MPEKKSPAGRVKKDFLHYGTSKHSSGRHPPFPKATLTWLACCPGDRASGQLLPVLINRVIATAYGKAFMASSWQSFDLRKASVLMGTNCCCVEPVGSLDNLCLPSLKRRTGSTVYSLL